MAYADQPTMSRGKLTSIIIVVLLHAALGYAFITGLAYNVIKQVPTVLDTFNVEQPKPPEEKPPPPPPENEPPPPPTAPPPVVQVQTVAPAPQIVTSPVVAPPQPTVITPPAPPAPPALAQPAKLRGNAGSLITDADYPAVSQRAGEEGVAGAAWDITPDGRVENCRITSSSGSSTLDNTTCQLITRRFRYKPAVDANGQPARSSGSQRVVWKIPKD